MTAAARRVARALALLCALTLTLECLALAVWRSAADQSRYEHSTLARADYASVGMDADGARAFARHTMAYLKSACDDWQPDVPFPISADFSAHMTRVRDIFHLAPRLLAALGALALLLLLSLALTLRQARRRLNPAAHSESAAPSPGAAPVPNAADNPSAAPVPSVLPFWVLGVALALLPVLLAALWALLDFPALWLFLHQTFLPDGLFPPSETVMTLFPVTLFADYLAHVALRAGAGVVVVLVVGRTMGTIRR